MKVLIADGSRVMRMIITRTLRQAGYGGVEIVEATNGPDALRSVADEEPDLVLSEWNLPRMTGLQLLQALRAEGDTRPFGFVTSDGSEQTRTLAAEAGALFLIAKPFTAESFADALSVLAA